jgi:hypothetical protein
MDQWEEKTESIKLLLVRHNHWGNIMEKTLQTMEHQKHSEKEAEKEHVKPEDENAKLEDENAKPADENANAKPAKEENTAVNYAL